MKFNRPTSCSEFEESLADYVAGRLPSSLRSRFELHLDGCRRCSELRATASGDVDIPDEITLIDAVLRQTSGSTCTELDGLIRGFQKGSLEPGVSDLVREHLDNCPGCSAVAFTLGEIGELLPEMAAIDPGDGFLGRVLAATSMTRGHVSRLDQHLERLIQAFRNPRFSLEAAYLGTLILFGLFALAGRFVDRSAVSFIPSRSSVAVSVEERIEPLIQAGGTGFDDAENLLRSLAGSALNTGDALWAGAQFQGVQVAREISNQSSLVRLRMSQSTVEAADWIQSRWHQLRRIEPEP